MREVDAAWRSIHFLPRRSAREVPRLAVTEHRETPHCGNSRLREYGASMSQRAITQHWTPRAFIYLALSIVGLVWTFTLNAWTVVEGRNYFADLFGSGPAVSSIGVDLLVVAIAGVVLIFAEARRLRMKRAWLYVVLSAVTAFAFTFPLFLAMRERKIAAREAGEG